MSKTAKNKLAAHVTNHIAPLAQKSYFEKKPMSMAVVKAVIKTIGKILNHTFL